MIDALDIYLFGLLLNLRELFVDLGFLGTLFFIITIVVLPVAYDFNAEKIVPALKKLLIVFISVFAVCIIGKNLAPTKEIATAMLVVPPVVNNEKVQEIPENVLDFVNGWLKENTPKAQSKESF